MEPKQRSDTLLPNDDEVAEEVSTDQQSEQARKTGHPPERPPGAPGAPGMDNAAPETLIDPADQSDG
jgi:hypothetical protein